MKDKNTTTQNDLAEHSEIMKSFYHNMASLGEISENIVINTPITGLEGWEKFFKDLETLKKIIMVLESGATYLKTEQEEQEMQSK